MADSDGQLESRIKELDLLKREEELRQLKMNARVRWVTPTALATLLPLIAGFGVWTMGEVRQYNEGFQALKELAILKQEKEALRQQKDSLNIEIATLLQLKEHYAGQAKQLNLEVEAKQEAMDKSYLRAVSMSADTVYALSHITAAPGPDRKAREAMQADLKQLPRESAARMENILSRYDLMNELVSVSRESILSFEKALKLIPASEWARQLKPMPKGLVIPGREILVSDTSDGRPYYDVTEGRFLTKEESKEAPP